VSKELGRTHRIGFMGIWCDHEVLKELEAKNLSKTRIFAFWLEARNQKPPEFRFCGPYQIF